MHFTREPILETVITARDGYKLMVRSTKSGTQEEFTVDALEVVSFGAAIFYRNVERPKPFLVPVADYEVIEMKEHKMTLKSGTTDKSTKNTSTEKESSKSKSSSKKKTRKKRTERSAPQPEATEEAKESVAFSRLFPPPSTLIKEQLTSSKEEEIIDANILPPEERKEEPAPTEEKTSSDFPEPEPLDQPIFNPDFFEEKEEAPEEEATKNE